MPSRPKRQLAPLTTLFTPSACGSVPTYGTQAAKYELRFCSQSVPVCVRLCEQDTGRGCTLDFHLLIPRELAARDADQSAELLAILAAKPAWDAAFDWSDTPPTRNFAKSQIYAEPCNRSLTAVEPFPSAMQMIRSILL
jgi:hypothetical protein